MFPFLGQGIVGAFNFDAITIVGVVILLLLISILIVLLVVICHRRQEIESKPRPPTHHTTIRGDDRHLMSDQVHMSSGTGQNDEHRQALCHHDEDRIRLTQCDGISPTHVHIGSPPPYDSIMLENEGCDPVKAHDQRLILSHNHLRSQYINHDLLKKDTDFNLIDVGTVDGHPNQLNAIPVSVSPTIVPPYGEKQANHKPAITSPLPTAPPMETDDHLEQELC